MVLYLVDMSIVIRVELEQKLACSEFQVQVPVEMPSSALHYKTQL